MRLLTAARRATGFRPLHCACTPPRMAAPAAAVTAATAADAAVADVTASYGAWLAPSGAAGPLLSTDCAAALGVPRYDPTAVDVVVYHANCPDGFAAALAAWKRLGDAATYVPAEHGPRAPVDLDVRGKRVVLLDYCFKQPVLERMRADAASLVVVDHHASAAADLDAALPQSSKVLQLRQSGATLAWNYFHPSAPVPVLLRYIEDRDIWRWALRDSRAFAAGMVAAIGDFAAWDAALSGGDAAIEEVLARGRAVVAYQATVVERHVRSAVPCTLAVAPTLRGRLVNATTLTSDIGNALASSPGVDYALLYSYDHATGSFICSLRSATDEVDVSAIAKALGGGGHKRASGFLLVGDSLQPVLTAPVLRAGGGGGAATWGGGAGVGGLA